MSDSALIAATMNLIQAVIAMLSEPRDSSPYCERARATLERCTDALNAVGAAKAEATGSATPRVAQVDIGPRIAELRAHGHGVRQIARILGVNASTVSRRLRKRYEPPPVERER